MTNATRTKTRSRKASPAQREAAQARRAALTEQVEEFEAMVEAGDADAAILAAITRFMGKYSPRNVCMIVMQDPEATDVAGFKAWIERGRVVRKGEHGIAIIAPAGSHGGVDAQPATDTTPAVEAQAGRKFFKLTTVFDIRQTEPLAERTAATSTAGEPCGDEDCICD